MGIVLENEQLGQDFCLMRVKEKNQAVMGQFYMLRSWETYPVLSRPISVFDADGESVSFLYKVVGKGTALLRDLKPGDMITLDGPHGNGFPALPGKRRIALVGGGVGIAPLYLAAKTYKAADPSCEVTLYLGFSGEPVLTDVYEQAADRVVVNVGGFITDEIDTCAHDAICTCGPVVMMKVLYEKCRRQQTEAPLYVSMENRMACGIGACLVCSCKTTEGNRKVCKDGPVFMGSEVFGVEQ